MEQIKANELRIGNYFYWEAEGKKYIMQVDTEDFSGVENFKNYQPIPLDESILLSCGFEKDDTGVDMFDQDYHEWYQKEYPIIGVLCQSSDKSYLFDENTDMLRIKYLHQLQNLYFALTQTELEINLKELTDKK